MTRADQSLDNVANNLWIENVTRSRQMKERLHINVAATTKMEDIMALRGEMEKFMAAPENRRDFQSDFDIELTSLGDLKSLELRVEVRHKVRHGSARPLSLAPRLAVADTRFSSPTGPTKCSATIAATSSCASSSPPCVASRSSHQAAQVLLSAIRPTQHTRLLYPIPKLLPRARRRLVRWSLADCIRVGGRVTAGGVW